MAALLLSYHGLKARTGKDKTETSMPVKKAVHRKRTGRDDDGDGNIVSYNGLKAHKGRKLAQERQGKASTKDWVGIQE
eukprot:1145333-Pelagomonas_calceolata.AAC.1